MEQSGNIPIFNIPGTLFRNIPRNFIGNFFRIFWEYIMGMFREYFANNIPGTLFGNIPQNFKVNIFRIFWEYIMGMFFPEHIFARWDLQQFTKYLRLTLVSIWNSALQEKFNFCFSTVFGYYWQNFHFGWKTEH